MSTHRNMFLLIARMEVVQLKLARPNSSRSEDFNSIEEDANEVHDQLVRTPARFAYRVRECPEADTGGFHSMEGARQFQDRVVRCASGRVGWAHVGGLRRSVDRSQVLLDPPCFCIRGTTCGSRHGRCPGGA